MDTLAYYTSEMWDILTDVVLQEWFGFRLPPSKLPWDGTIYLPDVWRLLYCLDRHCAQRAKADIQQHYLVLNRAPPDISIFEGYGLAVPDDLERERNGLCFLSRQADLVRSTDDYLFIVQNI